MKGCLWGFQQETFVKYEKLTVGVFNKTISSNMKSWLWGFKQENFVKYEKLAMGISTREFSKI
jgi:hypothetical protein